MYITPVQIIKWAGVNHPCDKLKYIMPFCSLTTDWESITIDLQSIKDSEAIIMLNKVALITGASSGIGYATALEFQRKGFIVYGAARRTDRMNGLQEKGIHTVSLDVTDDASMIRCVNSIIEKEGHIDVLVNNAGYGSYGAIEDVPLEEARRQVEINVFGLARMIQLVLPKMRERKYGKIVNISSMGGKIWTPFGGWYHATKFAVEGLSDCLRMEVRPYGIDVIVVEPGGVASEWGNIAADNLIKASGKGAYAKEAVRTAEATKKTYEGNVTKPEVIAKCIVKAVTVKKPKTRYLLGSGA
jgi:short-subunit dehydrogenase